MAHPFNIMPIVDGKVVRPGAISDNYPYSPYDVINPAVDEAAQSNNAAADNFFNRWLNPGLAQRIEFGQQAALQMNQNDWQSAENAKWNDEREKMKRLIEAGINPLTAAEGVAGSNSSPNSPSSVSSPNTAPHSDVPAAIDSVGSVVDKFSSSAERLSLLDTRKKNLISDTFLKYKTAGYTEEQAKSLAIANAFLPTEKFLGILSMNAQMDKLKAEYKSIMQGIEESKVRIEELDAQIRLADAQGNLAQKQALLAEKNALLVQAQTAEQNWLNQKRKELGIDPRQPIENNLFMLGITGDERYATGLGIVRDVKFNQETGSYDAQVEHAYDLAYESGRAAYDFDWDAPPKTISEFIWKGVGNIKQHLQSFVSSFSSKSSSSGDKSVSRPSKKELHQSYLRYKSGLDTQYNILNSLRAELADRIAAGQNKVETMELRQEISRAEAELKKMPHSYNEFVKYVSK